MIPNPNNGYIPTKGEKVRIIGACHPMCLNYIVEVVNVHKMDGEWFFENKYVKQPDYIEAIQRADLGGDIMYSGGLLGGVEPVGEPKPTDIDVTMDGWFNKNYGKKIHLSVSDSGIEHTYLGDLILNDPNAVLLNIKIEGRLCGTLNILKEFITKLRLA